MKTASSISFRISKGILRQGYELTEEDIGTNLAPLEGFGQVLAVDVGKRCYHKDYGFAMENGSQRDKRKAKGPQRCRRSPAG